jgi:hypothetical protein
MSKSIEINNGKFNKDSITTHPGKHLRFKSTDGEDYIVDCEDKEDISADFPLSVPGDNKDHRVKIKDKAVKKNYTCTVQREAQTQRGPGDLGTTPPAMIIRVE